LTPSARIVCTGKLGRISSFGEENLARRRYRLQCRVFLHLHKALLRACAG
jgi:hypothetical protein